MRLRDSPNPPCPLNSSRRAFFCAFDRRMQIYNIREMLPAFGRRCCWAPHASEYVRSNQAMVIALFQQLRSRLTAPRLAAIVAAIVFVSGACVRADVTAPLRVQLRWLHQAQFAGYYVAEANTSRGLGDSEFELVAGGPGISPLGRLVKGEVDVAILCQLCSEALQARCRRCRSS